MNFYFSKYSQLQTFCHYLEKYGIEYNLIAKNNSEGKYIVSTLPSKEACAYYEQVKEGREIDR